MASEIRPRPSQYPIPGWEPAFPRRCCFSLPHLYPSRWGCQAPKCLNSGHREPCPREMILLRGILTPTESCLQGARWAEEGKTGGASSLLSPPSMQHGEASTALLPHGHHPLPSYEWRGPHQYWVLKTQLPGTVLCPPGLTGWSERVTRRQVMTVLCGHCNE